MWIKILISLAVVAFCIFLGYFAAGKYRARKKFFNQWYRFHGLYLNELGYARRPMAAFLKELPLDGDFDKLVLKYSEERTREVKIGYVTQDELTYLNGYFEMLGKGDAHSQSAFFTAQTGFLEGKKAESETQAKSRGELYFKLGLLAGLAVVILIV